MLDQTLLYREIHEQPNVLSHLLDKEKNKIQQLADTIQDRQIHHVVIAARGTSDNAGRYAQYLWGAVNGLIVTLTTPSLFTIYGKPPTFGDALVLGISQSGKSPDIVAVLAEARRQGNLTAAITNEADSDLAREADHVIELHAGLEKAVAATKTYTCELAAIALLSSSLAGDQTMHADLNRIPETVSATLDMNDTIAQIAPRYRYMRDCVVIGRGFNYATAFELALKMKELTYSIAEPYSSADFLHGPFALIEYGFPAIVIAPSGVMVPEMKDFVRSLTQRGAETVVISDNNEVLELADFPLALPCTVPEWLSPIPAIVPGQLLAMHLAHARNYDIDKPRGLQKVTETT